MFSGSVPEIERYLSSIPPEKTIPEQWCAQIYARILKKHTVIVCSDMVPTLDVRAVAIALSG